MNYSKLNFWNKFGFWGSVASLLGLILSILAFNTEVVTRDSNSGNIANIKIEGSFNKSDINQKGNSNRADISQKGDSNIANIVQN